jgi:hypothetical protein
VEKAPDFWIPGYFTGLKPLGQGKSVREFGSKARRRGATEGEFVFKE